MEPVMDRTGLGLAMKQAMIDLGFNNEDRRKIRGLMLKILDKKFDQFTKFHKTQCPQTMILNGHYVVENQYPIIHDTYQYYRVVCYQAEMGHGQYFSCSKDKDRRKFTIIEGYCKNQTKKKVVRPVSSGPRPRFGGDSSGYVKMENQSRPSTSLPKS